MAAILAEEVAALGFPIIRQHPAGVETEATAVGAMQLNLHLRTGTRVLMRLTIGRANSPDDMYRLVNGVEWESLLPDNGYFSVISSVDTPSIDNTMYANMKCKDAIADRIRSRCGKRPDSGSDTSKAVVFLYWHGSFCSVYVDSSGEPLSKRGWRTMPFAAPMRENLAAAVIRSMRWNSASGLFINPMCGSGTLAIEAALMARNIPSVWARSNFGFMHLRGFSRNQWKSLRTNAEHTFCDVNPGQITATDISSRAIESARHNAEMAGVKDIIRFAKCDFAETPVPLGDGVVALNPEYGERLGIVEELEAEYRRIGDFFKQKCIGKFGYIFTGNLDLAKCVGLRPKRRIEFFNADIDCRLLEYEMYAGSKKRPSE
ncbi:THUMP domain-containing protein [Ignavibacteria bacterium]|nr:class I SAM-dependent RNA methyltransferase [Bacteroidota bacterium]